jgi:hypothetical protein
MTDKIQFYAAYNYASQRVAVTICGLDCGDYYADVYGGVLVPFQSDVDQQLTPSLLFQMHSTTAWGDSATPIAITDTNTSVTTTVIVPVVIGVPYVSAGQLLRPATQNDTKSQEGGSLGKLKRAHQVALLVNNTQKGFYVGGDANNLLPAVVQSGGSTILDTTLYSGVYWDTLNDDYTYDCMVAWQVQRPTTLTVCGVSQFMETQEH